MAINDGYYLSGAAAYAANNGGYMPTGGMGPLYDTPGYYSGYRPQYSDPSYDPYNPWTSPKSFGASAWDMSGAIPGPLGLGTDLGAYQNAGITNTYNVNNVFSSVADRTANFGQQWVLPIGAYYLGRKIKNIPAGHYINPLTGKAGELSFGARAFRGLGRGVGGAIGGAGGGALRALTGFGGARAGAALGASMLGPMGAVVGAFAGDMIFSMGISSAINAATFEPYVDARRVQSAFQTSLSQRIIRGYGNGDMLGISSEAAGRIGAAVTADSWKDLTFSNAEYGAMADYGVQAGLYNDMGTYDAKAIAAKTKKIAKDVKRIMAVFGEKDMREAIGILAEFTRQGAPAGSEEASAALSSLRFGTMLTGRSARDLYSSIGSAGGGMYASAGMTGIAGVMNAMNVFNGMSNANNMGVLSDRMLAMMGGTQGATNTVLQSRLGLMNTDYNKLMLYNQFFGGGAGGSISQNLTTFAMGVGSNPLAAAGRMALHGQEMMDAQAKMAGGSEYMQAIQMLQTMYPGRQQFGANELASAFKSLGLSDQQTRATLLDINNAKIGTSPGALRALQQDAWRQIIEQNHSAYMGSTMQAAKRGIFAAGAYVASPFERAGTAIGRAADFYAKKWDEFKYGSVRAGTKLDMYYTTGGSYKLISQESGDVEHLINLAARGEYGQEARRTAEGIMSGSATQGDFDRLQSLTGQKLGPADVVDFLGNMGHLKRRVVDSKVSKPYLDDMLLSDNAMYGLTGLAAGPSDRRNYARDANGRSAQSSYSKQIRGYSKSGVKAFYALVGAWKGDDKDIGRLFKFYSTLTGKDREVVARMLGRGAETWNPTANNLLKALKAYDEDGGYSNLAKSQDALRNAKSLAQIDSKTGDLRVATAEEQQANLAGGVAYLQASRSKGVVHAADLETQAQAVKSANARQRYYSMVDTQGITSIDGSGDQSSSTMLRASQLFERAVVAFGEGVVLSSKRDTKDFQNALSTIMNTREVR